MLWHITCFGAPTPFFLYRAVARRLLAAAMAGNLSCLPASPTLTPTRIGRITTNLLLSLASTVDIVEPIAKFTAPLAAVPGVGAIHNVGLESWEPAAGTAYDLVWNQWCLGHLTDAQLVAYLRKCGALLRRGEGGRVAGWVVVKENLTRVEDVYDEVDSSVTR